MKWLSSHNAGESMLPLSLCSHGEERSVASCCQRLHAHCPHWGLQPRLESLKVGTKSLMTCWSPQIPNTASISPFASIPQNGSSRNKWSMGHPVLKKPKRISQCCLINAFGQIHSLHHNMAQWRLKYTWNFSQQSCMLSTVIILLLVASPRATVIWIFRWVRNTKMMRKNERLTTVLQIPDAYKTETVYT